RYSPVGQCCFLLIGVFKYTGRWHFIQCQFNHAPSPRELEMKFGYAAGPGRVSPVYGKAGGIKNAGQGEVAGIYLRREGILSQRR
ncbi:hypothetical protein LZ339_14375, partial [Serratia marcescens]